VDAGGPAASSGIRAGWIVEQIDSVSLQEITRGVSLVAGDRERRVAAVRVTLRIAERLTGPAGTPVRLVLRDERDNRLARSIVRRPMPGQPVQLAALPVLYARLERERIASGHGCVGVIRFNVWMTPVAPAFEDAVTALADCAGIVLDVRGNIGGVAAMVTGLAGFFFDSAVTLGVLKARGADLRYLANPRRVTRDGRRIEPYAGPLAIVIDELSASTTELFAGALQQLGRARVFGSVSAGQALPSLMARLPNGDALLHVVADFVTPAGKRLEGVGVIPDETIDRSRARLLAGEDEPVRAAVRWITGAHGRDGASW
jgi:carboxyl-terminal processing protease